MTTRKKGLYIIRRLGEESSNDALVSVLKGEVVVGAALVSLGRSFGLGGLLDLRVRLLDESEPSSQVGKSISSNGTNGDLVGPQSLPDLGLELSQSVALKIGSKSQVLVQIPHERLNGAEIAGQLAGNGLELVVLHLFGLCECRSQQKMKCKKQRSFS